MRAKKAAPDVRAVVVSARGGSVGNGVASTRPEASMYAACSAVPATQM